MGADEIRPVLDDPARVEAVDRRNMLRQINEFPEQCETALGIARSFEHKSVEFEPTVVFLSGTGDCRTAVDMALAVSDEARVPIIADYGGRLPAYVNETALVVIVDYTGKNRSALQCYREARARNAEVVCISGGGKLAEAAAKEETRIIKIPSAQLPRTALGYMFAQLIGLLSQYGVTHGLTDAFYSGIKLLKSTRESLRFEYPATRNLAKQIATFLYGKIPVLCGAGGYRSVVARRWKSQIGANSKRPAFSGLTIDMAAGSISAWELVGGNRTQFAFVFIKDPADKAGEVGTITERAVRLLSGTYAVLEVDMQGASAVEKLLFGLYLGDYVSYYLALLYEVDPTKTDFVTAMESEPAEDARTVSDAPQNT